MNKQSIVLSLFLISILGFLYTPLLNSEADTPPRVVDITTLPSTTFVDMRNLKPGDTIIHDVKVLNSGNTDFSYVSKAELSGGSEEYFNRLLINVTDSLNNILYSGKLKDFTGFQPRKLLNGTEEKLYFEVNVPGDLDNSFQGLSTTVLFKFSVQDNTNGSVIDEPENDPSNGSPLPKTATETFDVMLMGVILLFVGLIIYVAQRKIIAKITVRK